MHDTFLFDKILKTVEKVCNENKINELTYLKVRVYPDSHITDKTLLDYIKTANPSLVSGKTKVEVKRNLSTKLMAIVDKIEGEQ